MSDLAVRGVGNTRSVAVRGLGLALLWTFAAWSLLLDLPVPVDSAEVDFPLPLASGLPFPGAGTAGGAFGGVVGAAVLGGAAVDLGGASAVLGSVGAVRGGAGVPAVAAASPALAAALLACCLSFLRMLDSCFVSQRWQNEANSSRSASCANGPTKACGCPCRRH